MATEKTFYLETFGCQMNAHDSEKVIGTLQHEGYRQVENEEDAGLILYNTCSIRDKAEQKVFNRLNDYKKLHKAGKRFGVLGCVAQQEGEKIFERAPYVSLVSGSASYRKLPEMLARLEAGENRITGLDDRQTDETFETEFTARQNQFRGYITIIEGCDKFCSYCVVPYTRGKERSRGSDSVLVEARRIADQGYTEIQLLGQNVNSYRDPEGKRSFAELLAAVGEVGGIRRVRFTTSHPRDFTRDIVDVIDAVPTLCDHVHLPVQSGSARVLKHDGARVHPGVVPGEDQLDQERTETHLAFNGYHRRFSRRNRGRFHSDHGPSGGSRVRLRVWVQVLIASEYACIGHDRFHT
jgi:tRNA-2-methylthio-N6-dimethylallyladenosine synthase